MSIQDHGANAEVVALLMSVPGPTLIAPGTRSLGETGCSPATCSELVALSTRSIVAGDGVAQVIQSRR